MNSYEVLMVDDGSTDGSGDILKHYAGHDERFKYIFQANQGPAVARNTGITLSEGKYLLFVDPDDWLPSSGTLELLVEKIEGSEYPVVGGSLCFYDNTQKSITPYAVPKALFDIETVISFNDYQYSYFFQRFIYSSKFIKDNQLFFPNIRRFQDVLFFLNVMAVCKKFLAIPEATYVYRGNNRSASFYSKDKLLAWISGVKQTLDISHKNHWPKLHYDTVRILTYDNFLEASESLRESFDEDYDERMEEVLSSIDLELLQFNNFELDSFYPYYGVFLRPYLWSINHVPYKLKSRFVEQICDKFGVSEIIQALLYNYHSDITSLVRLTKWFPHQTINRPIQTIGIYNEALNTGGVERCISIFIPMFIEMGYNIVLFTDTEPEEDKFYIPGNFKRVVLPGKVPFNMKSWMERINVLAEAIKSNNIDVIHYHSYWKQDIVFDEMVCKLVCHIPFILHHHNVFSAMLARGNSIFDNAIELYSFADLLITMSNVDQLYFRLNGLPAVYIPNPVGDFEEHRYIREEKTILWSGRFVPNHKQPIEMLYILNEIVHVVPDVKLYMLGDGAEEVRNELIEYVSKHNLESNILFTGFVDDVEEYYKKAKVMVMTSCIEGFPMVVAECKSFGLPLVAYDLPYVEMIREKNSGVVRIEQGDFSAAALAVVKLFDNSEYYEKLSHDAFNSLKNYSNANLRGKWSEVLNWISGKGCNDYSTPNTDLENMEIIAHTLCYHIKLNKKQYSNGIIRSADSVPYEYDSVLGYSDIPSRCLMPSSFVCSDYAGNPIELSNKGSDLLKNGWKNYYSLPRNEIQVASSIGTGMKLAYHLYSNLSSSCDIPFYMFSGYPLTSLLHAIFLGIPNLFVYTEIIESGNNLTVIDKDLNLTDTRDFKKDLDFEIVRKKVTDRERFALSEFINRLESSKSCLLVSINRHNDRSIIDFSKKMHERYPNIDFEVLIVNNYPELKNEILYRDIFRSMNVVVRLVAMNDVTKTDWHGNYESWRRLFIRFKPDSEAEVYYNPDNAVIAARKLKEKGILGADSILLNIELNNYNSKYYAELSDILNRSDFIPDESNIDSLFKLCINVIHTRSNTPQVIDLLALLISSLRNIKKDLNLKLETEIKQYYSLDDQKRLESAIDKVSAKRILNDFITYCSENVENSAAKYYCLFLAYFTGRGVPKDGTYAEYYYKQSSLRNHQNFDYDLINLLWKIDTPDSYRELHSIISSGGFEKANALQIIGRAYRDGTNVEVNLNKSAEWMARAYQIKSDWVVEYLNVLQQIHSSDAISELKTISELESAKGNPYAIIGLARLLLTENKPKAYSYYRQSVNLNHKLYLREYTDILYRNSSEEELSECLALCKQYALINKDAAFRLAQMYRNGKGVPKDEIRAALYMKLAIDLGHSGAKKEYLLIEPKVSGTTGQRIEKIKSQFGNTLESQQDLARISISLMDTNEIAIDKLIRLYSYDTILSTWLTTKRKTEELP